MVLAFHLALHTLLSTERYEEGVVAIAMRGGDADTNAAIYGALAGAVEGSLSIPRRWVESLRPTRCLEDLLGAETGSSTAWSQIGQGLVGIDRVFENMLASACVCCLEWCSFKRRVCSCWGATQEQYNQGRRNTE